jgi:VCBS repeat-containing protein
MVNQMFRSGQGSRWLLWGILLLFVAGLWVPVTAAVSPSSHPALVQPGQPLTLEARIACQTKIEELYWQHRLWPAENPTAKPSLSAVMPPAAIEAKVLDSLAQSQALADHWQQPITPAMLQAEINRQASQTQEPELLGAIWAALGNNPVLIAECLARPVLAERLIHNQFEQDERLDDQTFAAWWQTDKNSFVFDLNQPAASYQLPALGRDPAEDDTWQDTAAIPDMTVGEGVWTGVEMLYLGNSRTQPYTYDPVTDTWDNWTTVGAPPGVFEFTAVWTGTEMITWGGCNGGTEFCTTSMGGRYNPTTDTWTLTSTAGAPLPRRKHGAVWTGTEMLIWGGCRENSNGNQNCAIILGDGGRYNPTTDSWQLMSTSGEPAPRTFPPMLWTDDEMIVWSGSAAASPGARYNPTTNTWQPISTTNAPAGNNASLVWTGSEMIAWGGCTGSPFCDTYYNTGGRYNPDTNTWTPTSTTNAPSPRSGHEAVWTGTEMLVWGGYDGSTYSVAGGRYNPTTDTWTDMSTAGAPTGRVRHQTHWTGSLLLIWGGTGVTDSRNGARYDPITDSWTPISCKDPYSFREHHTAIWTGVEMIAWGGFGDGTAATGLNTGRIYDPVTDSWSNTSTANAPSPRAGHTAVWTGTEMIVWGGNTQSWSLPGDGGRYNPMTDSWTDTATAGAPEAPTYHSAVWTGTEMIVFGGSIFDYPWHNGGGRYNPTTNSWTPLPTTGAPVGRYLHTAVWTGTEMLIWGGAGSTGSLGDGASYDPTSNSWTPISTTNDPSARFLHTAIWDGTQMIIWGGAEDYSPWTNVNTGGLYDPISDSWTPTSVVNAPSARSKHTAVWTGDEMIVWSGCTSTDMSCLHGDANGGRYDPQTNTWTPTSTVHAPEARQWHTAVWTGNEMIVWGGMTEENNYGHTGGRYYATTSGNNAPQANNDSYTTLLNTPKPVGAPGPLANDSDPDNDPLTAVLVAGPTHGTLDFNTDGSFLYTPDEGYMGTDSFTYRASDGDELSNVATVAIVVESNNSAPSAADDDYTTDEDTPLTVAAPGVLTNDLDPQGDPLTAVLATNPANGTITLNADGSFTYTPNPNFNGSDTFTYHNNDGSLDSNEATVTITVDPINDAPVAADDGYLTPTNTPLSVTAPGLLGNDQEIDGQTLTAAISTQPTNGTATVSANGSFTYTPNPGFSGLDTFTYQINDGTNTTDTATVTIQVTGENTTFLPLIVKP